MKCFLNESLTFATVEYQWIDELERVLCASQSAYCLRAVRGDFRSFCWSCWWGRVLPDGPRLRPHGTATVTTFTNKSFGLPDPAIAAFLAIAACAFGGFIGGTLGAAPLWRLMQQKQILTRMDKKEIDLYSRIKRNRPESIRMSLVPGAQVYYQLT
jgi:hypothetical protein